MDSLPTELITDIFRHYEAALRQHPRSKSGLASYALVSRQWQQVVERRMFSSIRIKDSELALFEAMYGDEPNRLHRRSALQRLEYSTKSMSVTEEALGSKSASVTACVKKDNTDAVLRSLDALFSILKSWSTEKYLELEVTFPSDIVWSTMPERVVPITKLVKRFVVDSRNMFNTALLNSIATHMIGLQEIDWELDDWDKSTNSLARRKKRYDFAKQLRSLANACPRIQVIELRFMNGPPSDENIIVPSILLPHHPVDHLSQSIGCLSLMTKLKTLILHSIVASTQLFQPCQSFSNLPLWPCLRRLEITFSAMAADGGWLLERNPDPGSDNGEESDDEEDESLVRRRIGLQRLHRVQEEEARSIDFEGEFDPGSPLLDNISDTSWSDNFRVWPSQKLEEILLNLTRTAAQMPALRILTAGLDMPFCAMHQRLELFYLASGETHADCLWLFTKDSEHRHQHRLYWRVPRSWRMNGELEQAWRVVLGEDGVIDYHDWYGDL